MNKNIYIITLFFSVLLVLSCKKEPLPESAIRLHQLEGSWQMIFMDDGHYYMDNSLLSEKGYLCNLVIGEDCKLTVYDGMSPDTKLAEWTITELGSGAISYTDSVPLTLEMEWPEKMKYDYHYKLSKNEVYYNLVYMLTPVPGEEVFVFLNNKNLDREVPGSYGFEKVN